MATGALFMNLEPLEETRTRYERRRKKLRTVDEPVISRALTTRVVE